MRHRKPQTQEDLGAEDSTAPILNYGSNVLDETVVASIDHGLCLSMHQPYASLLVAGVKKYSLNFIIFFFLISILDMKVGRGLQHTGVVFG